MTGLYPVITAMTFPAVPGLNAGHITLFKITFPASSPLVPGAVIAIDKYIRLYACIDNALYFKNGIQCISLATIIGICILLPV